MSISIFYLNWSEVPTSINVGTVWYLPLRIIYVVSYYFPSTSGLLKNKLKAFKPQLADFDGLLIGAKAETDLYSPVFNDDIKAPWPPILNPVIDLLSLLTGKYVETSSGSYLLM